MSGPLAEPTDSAPDPGVERHGLVALEARLRTEERGPRLFASAYFWQTTTADDTGCEVVERVGACEVSQCIPLAAAAVPDPGFEWLSAGAVGVSGTKLEFSLTEVEHGDYAPSLPSSEMSLWDGGEALSVSVAGSNDFPAIRASLTAPRPVMLTAPDLASEPHVDPSTGLAFAWSNPTLETVYVEVEEWRAAPYPAERETTARCAFPASTGRGVVPAAVFEAFSDSALLHGYRFRVMTDATTELGTGSVAFTFLALSESKAFDLPIGSATETERASAASANVEARAAARN